LAAVTVSAEGGCSFLPLEGSPYILVSCRIWRTFHFSHLCEFL